ncbi:LPS export ABC transporter periplasmic protein LptC [Cyanobium sp. CH-040]|uniref:LPS export ABC transporter periplasmic protein LptC n=1 Tax=Cyanobium sp. CH-040 TaxID=2823708 RepID=UPI0020CD0E2E|nr:LPS export ABC transporter periplasmic protein LptC [Cyanobium sp. CH-040]MCP9926960.1 LPS export ABC transporter periplasmic protein LptC [Cyanobium sp. CH-040]
MTRRRGAGTSAAGVLSLSLLGCAPTPQAPPPVQPFVFRALNLRQQDPQGRPLWRLSSPETRYDLSRKLAQSRDLTGVLYEQGQPLYRFSAANGVVLNDGELVQLEGPIRLERLDKERPLVVTGLRLRWYPRQERMEIDRDPRATSGDLQLTAGTARFLIDQDRLELRRSPRLSRGGEEPLQLDMRELDWLAEGARLLGRGPVLGRRTLAGGAVQTLTAPGFTGSTSEQTVDLQAPVRLEDPSREAVMEARATRLDIPRRQVSSSEPFQGRYGTVQFSGSAFRLDLGAETVQVQGACRLQQPGDQLQAQTCLWNWGSGQVSASGGVVLRRQANGLETRAERLQGRIASDGFAQFTSPGGRVRTELQLPGTAAGAADEPLRIRPDRDRSRPRPPAFQL